MYVCVCGCPYMYVTVSSYMCVSIMFICLCMCVFLSVCLCVRLVMYTSMCVYTCMYAYASVCPCMYKSVYVYAYGSVFVLKHPNIVRFIGVYYPKRHSNIPAMIMKLKVINKLVCPLCIRVFMYVYIRVCPCIVSMHACVHACITCYMHICMYRTLQ